MSKAHIKGKDSCYAMKKWLFLLVALLAVSDGFALRAEITEIMYNPMGDDNNKEFVEVLLDEPANLSGYIIGDTTSNDTLLPLIMREGAYALIVEEGFTISSINASASIYSAGNTMGNNLDNTADQIFLYASNGSLLVTARYNGSLANGNGKSVEFIDGIPRESPDNGGSPGRENPVITISIQNITNTSTTTTLLNTTILNATNESQENGEEENTNETTGITDEEDEEETEDEIEEIVTPTECQPDFSISTPKDVYPNREQIAYTFHLNYSDSFIIEYGIDDILGRTIKAPLNTTNLRAKTYTPRIQEQDKVLVIKARLRVSCTDVILQTEKQLIVLNPSAQAADAPNNEDAPDASSPDHEEEASREHQDNEKPAKTKISYELLDLPSTIGHDSEFTTHMLIENNQEPHQFEVWSYVYRGPKSYSGEREDNLQRVTLPPGESALVELQSIVEAVPGAYKYKVKIRKDGQSTTMDITKELTIIQNASLSDSTPETENGSASVIHPALVASVQEAQQQAMLEPAIAAMEDKMSNKTNMPSSDGAQQHVVFEGKTERLKYGIPYFLIAVLGLIVMVFVWKA